MLSSHESPTRKIRQGVTLVYEKANNCERKVKKRRRKTR
jgi:hypothetical protein